MKKTVILFVLLLATGSWAMAQLSISTNFRQDARWDDASEVWDVISTDEAGTLFEFNQELTQFKHTTPTITSTYYISKWEYNDSLVQYSMRVTSDAGNEYELIIDGIENCVAFFFWRNNQYTLVRHTIKESWFKEE